MQRDCCVPMAMMERMTMVMTVDEVCVVWGLLCFVKEMLILKIQSENCASVLCFSFDFVFVVPCGKKLSRKVEIFALL